LGCYRTAELCESVPRLSVREVSAFSAHGSTRRVAAINAPRSLGEANPEPCEATKIASSVICGPGIFILPQSATTNLKLMLDDDYEDSHAVQLGEMRAACSCGRQNSGPCAQRALVKETFMSG
jgi:hypothetical protein